jgi:hypothetical protein
MIVALKSEKYLHVCQSEVALYLDYILLVSKEV